MGQIQEDLRGNEFCNHPGWRLVDSSGDVRPVTSSFDILYIFAAIVEFAHALDVGIIDYRWRS